VFENAMDRSAGNGVTQKMLQKNQILTIFGTPVSAGENWSI
jgi:hypothetical protein